MAKNHSLCLITGLSASFLFLLLCGTIYLSETAQQEDRYYDMREPVPDHNGHSIPSSVPLSTSPYVAPAALQYICRVWDLYASVLHGTADVHDLVASTGNLLLSTIYRQSEAILALVAEQALMHVSDVSLHDSLIYLSASVQACIARVATLQPPTMDDVQLLIQLGAAVQDISITSAVTLVQRFNNVLIVTLVVMTECAPHVHLTWLVDLYMRLVIASQRAAIHLLECVGLRLLIAASMLASMVCSVIAVFSIKSFCCRGAHKKHRNHHHHHATLVHKPGEEKSHQLGATTPVRMVEYTLVKVLATKTKHGLMVAGVYVYHAEHRGETIAVYRQVLYRGEKARVAMRLWESRHSSGSAEYHACMGNHAAAKSVRAIDASSIQTVTLGIVPDLDSYRRLSAVQYYDVYGKMHASLAKYLCTSIHLSFANVPTYTPGHVDHLLAFDNEDCAEALPLRGEINEAVSMNPSIGRNGIVLERAPGAPMNSVLMCTRDGMCRLSDYDMLKSPLQDDHAQTAEQVKRNTEIIKELMATNGQQSVTKVGEIVGNADEFAHILSQLSPENDKTFRLVKSALGFMSSFSSYVPSFIRSYGNGIGADSAIDLSALSQGTKLNFGEPRDYATLCENARPGDILIVHGQAALSSFICKAQQRVRGLSTRFISHVGMIVTTETLCSPGMIEGELYLLHSSAGGGIIGDLNAFSHDVGGFARHGLQITSVRSLLMNGMTDNTIHIHCPLAPKYRDIFDKNCTSSEFRQCLAEIMSGTYTTTPANFLFAVAHVGSGRSSSVSTKLRKVLVNYAASNSTPFGQEYFCSEALGRLFEAAGCLRAGYEGDYRGIHPSTLSRECLDRMCTEYMFSRQLLPIDFVAQESVIPYMFDDQVHTLLPLTRM